MVSRVAPAQAIQTFTQTLTYDELGLPSQLAYPNCSAQAPCAGAPSRTVTNGYAQGRLTSVGGFASVAASISYNPNGTIYEVKHAVAAPSNVIDRYTADATLLPRPKKIEFVGWSDCDLPQPVISASSPVCAGSGGNTASVAAVSGATYAWSITNGTITAGSTTNVVTYTAGPSGGVTLAVVVTVACGSGTATTTLATTGPTAAVSGGATIDRGASATLQVALTGTAPWTVTWSDGASASYSASPALRQVTPAQSTSYTVTALRDASCSGTASGSATITVVPPTPASVAATFDAGASSVSLTWQATGAGDTYVVQRRYGSAAFTDYAAVGASSTPSFTDNDTDFATRGVVAYLYRVVAVSAGTPSLPSSADLATRLSFTDPSLVPGLAVRGIHLAELRRAADAVRATAGLAALWPSSPAVTGPIYATQWYASAPASPPLDVFTALNQARAALGLPTVTLSGTLPAPGATMAALRQQLQALRAGVQ